MIGDFDVYYIAALQFLRGQSPYADARFLNPIWALLPVIPLTLVPLPAARIVWSILTFCGLGIALERFGLPRRRALLLLMATPLALVNVLYGNLDWLVILGATLPPLLGVWLVLLKPQIGALVVGVWLWRFLSHRSWLMAALLVIPPLLMMSLQVAIYGLPAWVTR